MYSIFNEEKSVVAEIFVRTLKNKIFKHMTAISKNVYFGALDDIANKYNNTVHRTIKMKPIEVTDDSFAEYNEESNKKNPKFKVRDHVRISKYKDIFVKGYAPNYSEEIFVINKVKNKFHGLMLLVILMLKRLLEVFMKKKLQKTNQKEFRIEKVLKRKGVN